jgi:hypothetical protein
MGTREELDGEDSSAPASACCWERRSRRAPQPWAWARIRLPFARPHPRRAGDSLSQPQCHPTGGKLTKKRKINLKVKK